MTAKTRALCAIAISSLALALPACATTKNYGMGECKEYTPICLAGNIQCERDDRGCEVCTCIDTEGSSAPSPNLPPR